MELSDLQKQVVQADAKYPMRFCCPCYFGDPAASTTTVNNGTVTLVRYRGERFGLTAAHVIQGYLDQLASNENCQLMIGGCRVAIDSILLDKCDDQDICVLYLEEYAESEFRLSGGVPTEFLSIDDLGGVTIGPKDFVLFGGYPGVLRKNAAHNQLDFGALSSGATEIEDVVLDQVVCCLKLHEAVIVYGDEPLPTGALGGLSGGPVFARKTSEAGIVSFPLIGTIFEYGPAMDILRIRLLSCLDDKLEIKRSIEAVS